MRERLREVPKLSAAHRLDLLAEEAQRGSVRQHALAELPRPLCLTDLRQGRREPERADGERPLPAGEAVLRLVDPVAEHESVLLELLRDREDRGTNPLVA